MKNDQVSCMNLLQLYKIELLMEGIKQDRTEIPTIMVELGLNDTKTYCNWGGTTARQAGVIQTQMIGLTFLQKHHTTPVGK